MSDVREAVHASCSAEIDRLRRLLHETTAERDDAREHAAALTEQRDAFRDGCDFGRKRVISLTGILGEVFVYWERAGTTREDDEFIAECREQAGMEAAR